MNYLNELLFGYYPYLAGTVFLVGSLVRFDRDQYTWRSGSSQMLRTKNMRIASNLFHVGILLLFVGHLVGLLTPPAVYHALGLSTSAKQLMAVVAGGIFGTLTFVGLAMLLYRRMTDPRIRANSSGSDIFILWLLMAQLVLGLFTLPISLSHSEGSTMLLLAEWAQRIVTFRGGAAELVAEVSIVFKLHLLLGITIFLVFPFTRLVHIWSAPIWYLGRRYQVVRQRA
jgi:nitrate reductase gamma subunit